MGPLLFALLINDIHLKLNNSSILLYADNTVIYYAEKSAREVETVLNKEASFIATWFDENNLILNLKKGKAEFVLYGSSKKLLTRPDISININNTVITEVTTYRYLGVSLDNHITLQQYVPDLYKKAAARVKMLSRICKSTGRYVAETIYLTMI